MAEIAISFVVSRVAERLSGYLINEPIALSDVVDKVEWIERELKLMQAFLEHVENHGQSEEEGFNDWAEEFRDVARDAEDAIETFVIKSVKRRRVLYLVDKYKIAKELETISERMRDIAQRRINYEQTNIVVETPIETSGNVAPSDSSPNIIVTPAVDKLSYILSQNFVTSRKVRKTVEQVRDEVVGLQNLVSNLESTRESNEREKVWLEEVRGVCNLAVDVAEHFRSRRRKYGYERKLKRDMKNIRTQFVDALNRRLTYGVGEEDDARDKTRSRSVDLPFKSLQQLILPKLPFLVFYTAISPFYGIGDYSYLVVVVVILTLLLLAKPQSLKRLCKTNEKKKRIKRAFKIVLYGALIDFVIFIISQSLPLQAMILEFLSTIYVVINWAVSLWRSGDKNLESIRRDLGLMHALFCDTEGAEGLNERQKVWMNQLRVVAQNAESLVASNQKGGVFSRLKFASKINHLLYGIRVVSERKTIYGIENVVGTKGLVSLEQSTQDQESGNEINTGSVGYSDNSGREEYQYPHGPAPAASLQDTGNVLHEYRPVTGLKAKVQLIRDEMQLMN